MFIDNFRCKYFFCFIKYFILCIKNIIFEKNYRCVVFWYKKVKSLYWVMNEVEFLGIEGVW